MAQTHLLLIFLHLIAISLASGEFSCFDGSRVIPTSSVNDHFCDCPDGSDELQTDACAGIASDALPGFFCPSKPLQGKYISFPRSMMSSSIDSDCINTCYEEAKTTALDLQEELDVIEMGLKERHKMKDDGKELLREAQLKFDEYSNILLSAKDVLSMSLKEKQDQEIDEEKLDSEILDSGIFENFPKIDSDLVEKFENLSMELKKAKSLQETKGSFLTSLFQKLSNLNLFKKSSNIPSFSNFENSNFNSNLEELISDLENDIERYSKVLKFFKFSNDEAFLVLLGESFSVSQDYTYEVSLFSKAYQAEGRSKVFLGNFDENFSDLLNFWHFKDGDRCWNGPKGH
ncbi:hypothetical protein GEMRC1_009618 [Eukaryota sp. GEM-RC1]